jgi:hypothetical protein
VPQLHANLAILLQEQGRFEEASETYAECTKLSYSFGGSALRLNMAAAVYMMVSEELRVRNVT